MRSFDNDSEFIDNDDRKIVYNLSFEYEDESGGRVIAVQ